MAREELLARLATLILGVERDHPVRVAIDGVDAAGKTTLADELAALVARAGRQVIRASTDGFHRPRARRHARGAHSPEGYYLDSFDHDEVWASVLGPLGPAGARMYRPAAFDHVNDARLDDQRMPAADDAILLFDGVFLLRPELAPGWDLTLFLHIPFGEVLRRAAVRDRGLLGRADEVEDRYQRRYIPGQRLYLETVRPTSIADVVIDNSDPARPVVIAWPARST